MEMPARGDAAFRATIRFASAPTTCCCAAVGGSAALRMRHTPCGCRSAYLVGVRTNFRLPPVSTMRRAKQCRYFARSLPPCYRHSRLTAVRRGCKRSRIAGIHGEAMYTAPTLRSACSHSSCKLPMPGVEGPSPRLSLGIQRGYSLRKIPPLVSRRARRSPSRAYAGKGAALSGYPSLRAARGKHLRPCGRKKRAPLRVLFFKSLRISRTGTSGHLRR